MTHVNPHGQQTSNLQHVNTSSLRCCRRLVTARQVPVVELVGQAWGHGRELLRRQVDLVEPFPVPVEQQPRHPARDGRGVAGRGQLGEVAPLAPQALVRAAGDGEGARRQAAHGVHVRLAEGRGAGVLLPEAQQGPEFRSDARLLKNFSNRCVSCVRDVRISKERGFRGLTTDFRLKYRPYLTVPKQNFAPRKWSFQDGLCPLDIPKYFLTTVHLRSFWNSKSFFGWYLGAYPPVWLWGHIFVTSSCSASQKVGNSGCKATVNIPPYFFTTSLFLVIISTACVYTFQHWEEVHNVLTSEMTQNLYLGRGSQASEIPSRFLLVKLQQLPCQWTPLGWELGLTPSTPRCCSHVIRGLQQT